ncbi:MAG: hypothetical protein ACI9GW_003105, partial [Halieaceae bacterium]
MIGWPLADLGLTSVGKNIVICADGTWNRPEEKLDEDYPTNVLRLARAIRPATANGGQTVFYDWGLGSYHDKTSAGITGAGIQKNIQDGYRYLVQNYSTGDKIFLFGFSRGAYTVRALCGLIYNCGILKREFARHIPDAWDMYRADGEENAPASAAAKSFRKEKCHRSRRVHFSGVWDTVGALGIPVSFLGLFNREDEFYDTKMGSNITFARHAMAIDEVREDFLPTIWQPRREVDLKQVWFAGVHCDVGGSYQPDEKRKTTASDIPLRWILNQASLAGLTVESHLLDSIGDDTQSGLHKSRTSYFRLKREAQREMAPLDERGSVIPTLVHSSVRQRFDSDPQY